MDTANTGRRVLEGILVATPLTVGLIAATRDDDGSLIPAALPALLLGVGLVVAIAARTP